MLKTPISRVHSFARLAAIGLLTSAAGWSTPSANASVAPFLIPDMRANPQSTYREWDSFQDSSGVPTITDAIPDVADNSAIVDGLVSISRDTATVSGSAIGFNPATQQFGESAFITSGGNIYSFAAPVTVTVEFQEFDVPTPLHNLTAVLQVRTLGTEIDPSSFDLNGFAPLASIELERSNSTAGLGGSDVTTAYLFEVPYSAFGSGGPFPGTADLVLTFTAASSSLSLDRLALDTIIQPGAFFTESAIPEPSSFMLAGAGLGLIVSRRRRAKTTH